MDNKMVSKTRGCFTLSIKNKESSDQLRQALEASGADFLLEASADDGLGIGTFHLYFNRDERQKIMGAIMTADPNVKQHKPVAE